jgi:hypothetical protein
MSTSIQLFLKEDRTPDQIITTNLDLEREDVFRAIRCPLCGWRPLASSRWSCSCIGTPEPYFESCGTVWNTFSTGGRCPGCSHQWQWTTCLRCHEPSLHIDWYVSKDIED